MSFWRDESLEQFLCSDLEQAQYLLIGGGEIEEGKKGFGIFCATNDEFTAYRARRKIRQDLNNFVEIVVNSPDIREKIAKEFQAPVPFAPTNTGVDTISNPENSLICEEPIP